jgi:hypothetical protein
MEQTPFELTPKQKGILATLSRETGKPIPALLDEALEALQDHERLAHDHSTGDGPETAHPVASPPETSKPIWEQFAEAFNDVPDEDIVRLPTDLAAQVDHYVYGLPKRQV